LIDIAQNINEHSSVRATAVAKLTSQKLLTAFAKNDSECKVRIAAIEKLSNQNTLIDIAQNINEHSSVRAAAVGKLTDQKLLAAYAKNDSECQVREAAVKNLTNQKLLDEITKNDSEYEVRMRAYKKLNKENTQEALKDIVKNDESSIVRDAAYKKLEEINSQKASPDKKTRNANMYIGYYTNMGPEPTHTSKISVFCSMCDYWCEYEFDNDWKYYYGQTPKRPFWFMAKGHTGMAACGECGTIYCGKHSKDRNSMVCPKCGYKLARKAIFEALEKNR